MNIGYNKSTKELIGYTILKGGRSIVVTAYAVDDLEKKFAKELVKQNLNKINNHIEKLMGQLSGIDD